MLAFGSLIYRSFRLDKHKKLTLNFCQMSFESNNGTGLKTHELETSGLHFQGIIQGFKNLEEKSLGNQHSGFHKKFSNQLYHGPCLALK